MASNSSEDEEKGRIKSKLNYLLDENFSLWAHLQHSLKTSTTKSDHSEAVPDDVDGFKNFETWVQYRYMRRILYRENKHFILDIVALQKMCLQFRLKRISQQAFRLITSAPENIGSLCEELDEELRDYTAALQDMTYMDKFGLKANANDPFIITTERTSHQALLRDVWKEKELGKLNKDDPRTATQVFQADNKAKQDLWQLPQYPYSVPKPLDRKKQHRISQDPNHRFREEARRKYLEIFTWAFVGNLFLIAPMILMVLKPGLVTSLVTTSVCVTIFAAVATSFQDKIGDSVSATAAYAAVLVVFVGTSGGGTSV